MTTQDRASKADHLSNGELAAYLDRELSDDALRRAEEHLADCDYCCEQVIVATRSLAGLQRRRWPRIIIPTAAAAALAGVLFAGPAFRGSDGETGPILRDGAGQLSQVGEEPIEVRLPSDGAEVAQDSVRFAWTPIAEDAFYSFTMTDAVGDVIWEGTTNDTSLELSSRVILQEGARYFWYVDALFGEGRSASTGVREFVAAR